jgi:hypothetical protein
MRCSLRGLEFRRALQVMHENNQIAAGCCGSFVFNGKVSSFFSCHVTPVCLCHAESRQVISALWFY